MSNASLSGGLEHPSTKKRQREIEGTDACYGAPRLKDAELFVCYLLVFSLEKPGNCGYHREMIFLNRR
jgi:hypothetical protein